MEKRCGKLAKGVLFLQDTQVVYSDAKNNGWF